MSDLVAAYRPILDLMLISCGLALGQYVVLRAGVFSVAGAGLASIGAYTAGLLVKETGLGLVPALAAAVAVGLGVSLLLAFPLSRVRGVYQAIATLAFVQIVVSLMLYAEDLTGGPLGLNAIPKLVGTVHLAVGVAIVVYIMTAIDRSRLGSAFDAVRQDETVAAALGVGIPALHALAFAISGAVFGLFGGMIALHSYSLEPTHFGFPLLVSMLATVVLGGRRSVWGPLLGAAILTALPELARPLSENRALVHGALLVGMIVFLPRGIVDTISHRIASTRRARGEADLVASA